MACKILQRRWIILRLGSVVFLMWFLLTVIRPYLRFGFDVDKLYSSDQQPDKQRRPETIELTMRSGDPRTSVESDCPNNFKDTLQRCSKLNSVALGRLPKASIIITFHREETISSLLHTLHSIVQRTPDHLIEEIIVIDDASHKDDFGEILEIYLDKVFPNRRLSLRRNSVNLGLIRSRLTASRLAKGRVLVFMDSHSEVQIGWLEPLLYEIKKNRRSLVNSVVDWMEKNTENRWTYRYGCTDWTVVFDWSMGFGWNYVPAEEKRQLITDAYKSKTIIGTFTAIDTEFFREIGEFDEGMNFWGAENIDLSIRVWLFNGQVLTVPCSRAAHLEGNNTRSYRDAHESVVQRNYKRVAEVWFDEYKDCFYYYFPQLMSVDVGDLSERLKIKVSAPHNFKWYMRNIFPSLGCPLKDAFAMGPVRNLETGGCLVEDQRIVTTECADDANDQKTYWSNRFHLREPNYVLQALGEDVRKFEYLAYHLKDEVSKWLHWKDGPLMEMSSRMCLEDLPSEEGSSETHVALVTCNFLDNRRQTWSFREYTDQYKDLINNKTPKRHGKDQEAFLQVYHLYNR